MQTVDVSVLLLLIETEADELLKEETLGDCDGLSLEEMEALPDPLGEEEGEAELLVDIEDEGEIVPLEV